MLIKCLWKKNINVLYNKKVSDNTKNLKKIKKQCEKPE